MKHGRRLSAALVAALGAAMTIGYAPVASAHDPHDHDHDHDHDHEPSNSADGVGGLIGIGGEGGVLNGSGVNICLILASCDDSGNGGTNQVSGDQEEDSGHSVEEDD